MARTFAVLVVALLLVGCSRPTPAPEAQPVAIVLPSEQQADDGGIAPPRAVPVRTSAEALVAGVRYLLDQQSEDGSWRSDICAPFKHGTALTPLAIVALQEALDASVETPEIRKAIDKGCGFLSTFVKDRDINPGPDGFDYPIYTASLAIKAFSHPSGKDFRNHRAAWVKYLKDRQLTAKLGWKEEDKQFGGWGYCRVIPKKQQANTIAPPLIESNLSATLFALDALAKAGETDAEMLKAAAVFIRRCQNWPLLQPHQSPFVWSAFIDGGFHFIYDDPTRNKAGMAHDQPQIFHSYGSTTADGLQALALCNWPGDKERREAASEWLIQNFRADAHPGQYVKAHEPNRNAVYYYYAASVARVFRDHKLALPNGRDWAAELSAELVKRQYKDGHWENPVELVRENDPLVATTNAICALARCQK